MAQSTAALSTGTQQNAISECVSGFRWPTRYSVGKSAMTRCVRRPADLVVPEHSLHPPYPKPLGSWQGLLLTGSKASGEVERWLWLINQPFSAPSPFQPTEALRKTQAQYSAANDHLYQIQTDPAYLGHRPQTSNWYRHHLPAPRHRRKYPRSQSMPKRSHLSKTLSGDWLKRCGEVGAACDSYGGCGMLRSACQRVSGQLYDAALTCDKRQWRQDRFSQTTSGAGECSG